MKGANEMKGVKFYFVLINKSFLFILSKLFQFFLFLFEYEHWVLKCLPKETWIFFTSYPFHDIHYILWQFLEILIRNIHQLLFEVAKKILDWIWPTIMGQIEQQSHWGCKSNFFDTISLVNRKRIKDYHDLFIVEIK